MRYDEMREHVRGHFAQMLAGFRERMATHGPAGEIDALKLSQALANGDQESWLELTRYDSARALVSEFCERRGIAAVPSGRLDAIFALELQKGYREFLARALEHLTQFETLPLVQLENFQGPSVPASGGSAPELPDAISFEEAANRYFAEMHRNEALAVKTEADKRDALALLRELSKNKPLAKLTKADAREVKAALFKLPKNRNKNPRTRELPLLEMLDVSDVDRLSARTMNAYLGHMQPFFTWGVSNGYASENIFTGLKMKKKGTDEEGRHAFSAEQLRLMFTHLTDAQSPIVRKDVHKWPALIGMFTGMRLNEIAQLEVQDIDQYDGVWCVNVTPDGDDKKRLKNTASKRPVTIHDRLLNCGLLEFRQSRLDAQISRLFPDLPYSPQNGYGRKRGALVQ